MSRQELEAFGVTLQMCVMLGTMTDEEAVEALHEAMGDKKDGKGNKRSRRISRPAQLMSKGTQVSRQ